ncbi:MAG TPA: alpha-L-rhamnosidase C-terminal domain-containing protein [Longimicrobiaceae bacterium]|nr:alpha-L-rhamnosidase C-terminal domain-containing protein [Longimicrobiaceae bacterium]
MPLSSRALPIALSLLAALPLVAPAAAGAQRAGPRVFHDAPSADWIAPPGVPGDSFTVFHARRTIDLPERPAHFVVHVSADNRYRLFVNGEQVSSGPQRSDVAHWRYETVDLAPWLRAGRNVIAALVWNWGAARPVAQMSYRTGFLLQGDGPREAALVNTGPGWKLRVDSAYAPLPVTYARVGGYYAAAPGDSVDAARVPWGWQGLDYRDDDWYAVPEGRSPAVLGRLRLGALPGDGGTGEVVGWQLQPRDIPPMEERVQRLRRVRRATGVAPGDAFLRGAGDLVIPAHTAASVLLDQGHTTDAYPVLETSGGAGSTVTLTYAEALIDAQGRKGNRNDVEGRTIRGVRDVFRPSGENRRFQPLYWRSFRYVQMDVETGDEPLRIRDLHGVFTAYPFHERGHFTSNLAWIDSVWAMDWNGARIGAFETYMDTPYYEQLQYVGDTRIQALISLYVAGDDRLMRQAIEHFDDSRIPEGITASRYPSALRQLIPPFSLIYVAMVHDYYMHRDDTAFVRRMLPGVRTVLDWYGRHVDSTGMLGPMPYWNYLDWAPEWPRGVPPGADDGHSTAISLLYAYALRRAAAMEEGVGTPAVGAAYRARADSMVRAVRARAWDPARGLFRDRPDSASFSQQTNVLAILADAVPAADQRAVMERVLGDGTLTQATYYFSWYLFEALRKAGLADRYVEQLAPWHRMLALGLTSTPENPEPTRSDTHAWSAHPNYGLLATVLGVRPASPGFCTVLVAPALGPLRRAEGRVPLPAGDVDVSLARVGARGIRARVTLPPGVTGSFEWNGRRVALHPGSQEITQ